MRSNLSPAVRAVTWIALIHVILSIVGGYILMISTSIMNPRISGDQEAMLAEMFKLHDPVTNGISDNGQCSP